jgi:uncharacterized protein
VREPARDGPAHDGAERLAVGFARVLRGAGLDVSAGHTVLYAQALAAVGLHDEDSTYWAGRATLVRRPEDVAAYDEAFAAFWHGRGATGATPTAREATVEVGVDVPDAAVEEPPASDEGTEPVVAVRWSPVEVLRHRDFALYTSAEYDEARRLMSDLRLVGALRRSRRLEPAPRRRARGHPDLRRTIRRSLRSGREPIRRSFLVPAHRPRRIVLLCDVSGSMEPYARGLLRFLHAAVVGRGRVEAFALGTRLTRITRELSSRDPDAALQAVSGAVADWSGGTRLGEGLRAFNDRFGQRGLARGAVVVIMSDGWDRGDPDELAEQMARLGRVAYRVVWVNPLKASPGFAPTARGMAAALPYVDEFVDGHSLASLEALAEVIAR